MYELFLTALVEEADFSTACSVIEGLCGMQPWETIHRVLYFQGPQGQPVGLPNHASMGLSDPRPWKELHANLSRQAFITQVRYDLHDFKNKTPDVVMGNTSDSVPSAASASNLDAFPGMLRWTDFPDPPHGRPNITQRKKVEIWEQKNLTAVMRDNNYQFKTETVEEFYRFYREDIEFCFARHYFCGPIAEYMMLESRRTLPSPAARLPPWASLTPVDAQNRWVLQVKAHVLEDNKPDLLRKAQDQLLAIRTELDGVFDFRAIDRKCHDTRIIQVPQGVPVLPQKVKLGV